MWKVMQFVSIVGIFVLCVAELPHLSIEEFRKQETGRHKGQYGGIRGGIVTAETSIGVTTSASLMLSSLDLEPGLEQTMKQQQRCVDPYRNIPVYGWRWFQSESLNFISNSWWPASFIDIDFLETPSNVCIDEILNSKPSLSSVSVSRTYGHNHFIYNVFDLWWYWENDVIIIQKQIFFF